MAIPDDDGLLFPIQETTQQPQSLLPNHVAVNGHQKHKKPTQETNGQ